jgi:membrane protease YdiL (CAAX protease family)
MDYVNRIAIILLAAFLWIFRAAPLSLEYIISLPDSLKAFLLIITLLILVIAIARIIRRSRQKSEINSMIDLCKTRIEIVNKKLHEKFNLLSLLKIKLVYFAVNPPAFIVIGWLLCAQKTDNYRIYRGDPFWLAVLIILWALIVTEKNNLTFSSLLKQSVFFVIFFISIMYFITAVGVNFSYLPGVLVNAHIYKSLVFSFVVAVAEEIVFRHYLQGFLVKKIPEIIAITIVATIFYNLHYLINSNPVAMFSIFAYGCLAAYFKSIIPSVVLHWYWDTRFFSYNYFKGSVGIYDKNLLETAESLNTALSMNLVVVSIVIIGCYFSVKLINACVFVIKVYRDNKQPIKKYAFFSKNIGSYAFHRVFIKLRGDKLIKNSPYNKN